MKRLLLFLFALWMIPFVVGAQSTYGKITPLGGVTASLGQELTFSYTNLAGASYYWSAYPSVSSIPASSIVFTTSVDTRTVKVKFLEPMVAFLCVTRYKAGTQPAMECISFNVVNCAALPTPASLTGPTPISSCGSYTYTSAVVAGATGYQWSGFVTGDKQTVDPEITVFGSDFKLGNNSLKVKALNECGGSGSYRTKTVVVNGIAAPTSLTGPDMVLLAAPGPFSYSTSAVSQAVSYKWTGFVSGEKITTAPTVSVSGADFAEGLNTITVHAVDSCDAQSIGSASINVTGLTLGSPTSITGPASISFCGNGVYSTNSVVGAVEYRWSGFATGNKTTTSPSVSVSWTDFVPGSASTITVIAADGSGNSNGSASLGVTALNAPLLAQIGPPNTTPDFCGITNYSVGPFPGATSYVWTMPGFSRTTTSPSISLTASDWGTFNSTRVLSVYAVSCVNSTTSVLSINPQITLSAISGPSTVGCNSSGNYSIAPVCTASSYRWTVDGNIINTSTPTVNLSSSLYNGLTTIEVRAFVAGQFTNPAIRTVDFTCSLPFAASPTNNFPTISPNPSKNTFTVTDIKPAESVKEAQIRVLTQDGKLIKAYTTKSTSLNVEDLNLDTGVYLIEIRSDGQQSYRKLLINK